MTDLKAAAPASSWKTKAPDLASGSSEILMGLINGEQSIQETKGIVERSAPVVAKLISLANSAWSNPISAVATLEVACARLGLDVVRTVSIALLVGKPFNVSLCPAFDRMRFWASSLLTADIASELAAEFQCDPALSRTAGLLHNIGLLWLADILPGETDAALGQSSNDPEQSVDECLGQYCGVGYKNAGGHLFNVWQLPQILVAGIGATITSPSTEDACVRRLIEVSSHVASCVYAEANAVDIAVNSIPKVTLEAVFEQQRAKLPKTLQLANALLG